MAGTNELLNWCRAERKVLQQTLGQMESGQLRLHAGRPGATRDITDERIAEIKETIAELDAILARHPDA